MAPLVRIVPHAGPGEALASLARDGGEDSARGPLATLSKPAWSGASAGTINSALSARCTKMIAATRTMHDANIAFIDKICKNRSEFFYALVSLHVVRPFIFAHFFRSTSPILRPRATFRSGFTGDSKKHQLVSIPAEGWCFAFSSSFTRGIRSRWIIGRWKTRDGSPDAVSPARRSAGFHRIGAKVQPSPRFLRNPHVFCAVLSLHGTKLVMHFWIKPPWAERFETGDVFARRDTVSTLEMPTIDRRTRVAGKGRRFFDRAEQLEQADRLRNPPFEEPGFQRSKPVQLPPSLQRPLGHA